MFMKTFTKLWLWLFMAALMPAWLSAQDAPQNNGAYYQDWQVKIKKAVTNPVVQEQKNALEQQAKEEKAKEVAAQTAPEQEFDLNVLASYGLSAEALQTPEGLAKAEEIMGDYLTQQWSSKTEPTDATSAYTFSQSTGTYTEITGGTLLGSETSDDQFFVDPTVPLGGFTRTGVGFDIGFTFNYNSYDFDRFGINNNGWISLGQSALTPSVDMNTSSSYNPLSSTTAITPPELRSRITPFARDLQAQTGSELRYELQGTAPNRVLVIQFKNYKRYGSTGTGDSYNFQIRLYETTNVVEFVYGTMTNNATPTTGQVGLGGNNENDFFNRETTTDWTATTAGATNGATCTLSDAIFPPSGLTFDFTPPAVYPPLDPFNPSPADGAVSVATSGSLTWEFGANTTSYDLWFGPQGAMTEVVSGAEAGPNPSYPYSGLAASSVYEWQVIEHGAGGTTNGPVWSFTTACATVLPPVTESFDVNSDPVCWTNTSSNPVSNGLWEYGNATTNPADYGASGVDDHTGNGGFFAWADGSSPVVNDITLVSPFIDATGLTVPYLEFWLFSNNTNNPGDNCTLYVDFWDGAAWNNVLTYAGDNPAWQKLSVDLSGYAITGDVQFRFVVDQSAATTAFYNDILIDDIFFGEAPACPDPNTLGVSNVTSTSADLSWNSFSGSSNVEVGLTGFTVGVDPLQTFAGVTSPLTVNSLSPNTAYDFYVQDDCGGSTSNWIGPFSFTTDCAAFVPPLVESFDVNSDPSCWTNTSSNPVSNGLWEYGNATTNPAGWGAASADDHTGNGGFFAYADGSTPVVSDITLISPFIDASGLTIPYLEFYLFSNNTDLPGDDCTLFVDFWDGAAWNNVLTYSGDNPDWQKFFFDLSGFTITGDVRFRFVVDQSTATTAYYNDILIDDIFFGEAPSCLDPFNLSVSNNTATGIDLVWSSNSGSSNVQIGLTGFTIDVDPLQTFTGVTSPQTVNGLVSGTTYDFYVQDDCGGGNLSNWVGPYTFTYYPAPPNDDCVNAIPVGTSGYPETVTGTTFGANIDCPGVLDWNAVWYQVDLPYAHNFLTVDYCGTATDIPTVGVIYYWDCSDCSAYQLYDQNTWYDCGTPGGITVPLTEFWDIPGPATIYYPVYLGADPMDFTVTFDVASGPVADVTPASVSHTVVENGDAYDMLDVANNGDFRLDYTADVVYPGGSSDHFPQSVSMWTGTTDGTTFPFDSEVQLIGDASCGWMMFDISGFSLPPGAFITQIDVSVYVSSANWPWWRINGPGLDPLTTDATTMDATIRANANEYIYNQESSSFGAGWHTYTLGGNAVSDFQAALANGWWTLGMFDEDAGTTYFLIMDGWNEANVPYITVHYSTAPSPWLSIDGSQSVAGTVNAGDPPAMHQLYLDATGIPAGVYTADVVVNSNDPVTPSITVPVTMEVVTGIVGDLKVLLEGPYDAAGVMFTSLNDNGYLPLAQPYNPPLPYYGNPAPAWLYPGTETVASIPAGVVDWVLVQVRDAADPASASSATIESTVPAFVTSDGSVIALDGMSRLGFPGASIDNNCYFVVYHRNHLGVIANNPATLVGNTYTYDFTTAETQVYGGANGHKELEPGYWGMIAADGNGNGLIQNDDETNAWKVDLGSSGYLGGDFDMNGLSQNTDETALWKPNLGGGGQIPAKAGDKSFFDSNYGYQSQIPD
ncbi:MAG: hypothetical protein Kow00127_18550 [Bacteroidales bacterium]